MKFHHLGHYNPTDPMVCEVLVVEKYVMWIYLSNSKTEKSHRQTDIGALEGGSDSCSTELQHFKISSWHAPGHW